MLNQEFYSELERVATYCKNNANELIFVTPPVHSSIWEEVIAPLSMHTELEEYKAFLRTMALLLDIEQPDNELIIEYKNDFTDGFHMTVTSEGYRKYKQLVYNQIKILHTENVAGSLFGHIGSKPRP